MFNYRHPGPRRVWKGGLDLQVPPPFPGNKGNKGNKGNPGNPAENSERLDFEQPSITFGTLCRKVTSTFQGLSGGVSFFREKLPPEAAEHSSTLLLKKRDVSNKTHKFKFNEKCTFLIAVRDRDTTIPAFCIVFGGGSFGQGPGVQQIQKLYIKLPIYRPGGRYVTLRRL